MAALFLVISVLLTNHVTRGQDKTYNFREEEPEGTFIGNIALDLNLAALIPRAVFNKLHYSVMNWGDGGQFRVDENNSGLFTKYRLDREQLCKFEVRCVLKLRLAARSETDIKKYTIWVNLLDINDNGPQFNTTVFVLRIPESVTAGKEYTVPGALDDDRGIDNSIQSYGFIPSSDIFSVVYFKQLDGTSDVNLIVRKALDRETTDFYSLVLVAKDGGSPVRSASLVVNIQVTDDNDNTPRFSSSEYRVQIGENTRSGAVIITVTAEDDDIDANAAVEYRLSSRQEASMSELFQIDRKTGQLRAKATLTSGSYTIIIEAVDSGSPQRVNQTEVLVTVIDTENNPPIITVDPLNQDSQFAHVPETANKNALVAHVSVFDPDSGPNGIVLCYSQSAFFDLHALDDYDYILVVVRSLDREQTSEYRVALFCEDSGTPRLNATQVFDVVVDDINDNAPIFEKTNEQINLFEENAINDVAMILFARDNDIGVNARLFFSLLNDSNGFFKIPMGSNVLVCARKLDRETQDTHVVEIVARDGGIPPLSATMTVTILVLDINDVAPQFSQPSYKFSIPEGMPAGTFLGSVTAVDLDLGEAGQIEFSLPRWSTQTGKFQILGNGTLKTLRPLDRETSAVFTFLVQATDKGRPQLSSQVEVEVEVTDINDNAPMFIFPSSINSSIILTLPVDTSKSLIGLQVADADQGENGEVYFTLHPGNASRLFYVDAITGELHAMQTFSPADMGVYNLTLTATDRGATPLSATRHLLVQVTQNASLHSQPADYTYTLIAIGLVCATVIIVIIIPAIVCYVKRLNTRKPVRYLDTKENVPTQGIINAASIPNQYSHHKEPSRNLTMSSSDDTITSCSSFTYGATTSASGFTGCFEQYDMQIYPSVLQAVDVIVKGEEPESFDKELNRMTSLRLQQAFQHINSIKSRLITPLDTNKPYEWREIRIPGHHGDLGSLSSRATSSYNHNIDSGVGTDDDTVHLPRKVLPFHKRHPSNGNISITHQKHRARYSSRLSSDVSSNSSQPSSLSLPNLYLKPAGELVIFRPLSVRSGDICPSDILDDQCTTTSGSYSIGIDDHVGGRGSSPRRNLEYIHDIYV